MSKGQGSTGEQLGHDLEKSMEDQPGRISRRQALATLGLSSAAVAGLLMNGGFAFANNDSSVTDSVYGKGNSGPKVTDLRELPFVLATTVTALRAMTDPDPAYVYFVRESGHEGHYVYDPADTTTADTDADVYVSINGKRFKRIEPEMPNALLGAEFNVLDYNASGSALTTTGSIAAGSNVLTVANSLDFEVGQGILIAGAGAHTRIVDPVTNAQLAVKEAFALVIDEDALQPGTFTLSIPGESTKSVTIAATPEVFSLQIQAGCSTAGSIALVLDTVEYLIPVTPGMSPSQIADKIRGWYLEEWTGGGSAGSSTVTLTAKLPGGRRISSLYSQGTGVIASKTVTKGTRTLARDLALALRAMTYANWVPGGYSKANVVNFFATTQGAKGSEGTVIGDGGTGMNARIEMNQFGNYLLSSVTAITGTTVTLADSAVYSVSGQYVGHDDTLALQQALDAAQGRSLLVPAGTYKLSETLTPHAGTRICGQGKSATVLQFQSVSPKGIHVRMGADHIYIGHLKVKNVGAPEAYENKKYERHGITIEGAKQITVEHCWVDNSDDGGIRISYSANLHSSGCRILYNVVTSTAEGSGIEVIRGDDCLVLGNYVSYASQHGIRLCGPKRPIVIGNTVENCMEGISVQGFTGGGNVTYRVQDFVIQGNVVRNNANDAINIFNEANSGVILGNWIEGALDPAGILFKPVVSGGRTATCCNIVIEGNVIKGFAQGIQLRGDMRRIFIRGNLFEEYSTSSTTSPSCGVYLNTDDAGDLSQIVIEGNQFVCSTPNQTGIRLLKPTGGTSVYAHNNTFLLRVDDLAPAAVAQRALRNEGGSGYNADALVFMKEGECTVTLPDSTVVTGITRSHTNVFVGIPN